MLTTVQAVNEVCPWSGKPVSDEALTQYRGHTVGFCNPGCRDKFDAATTLFDAAIATEPARGAQPAPRTLLQLAGAAVAPVRLADAVLVVIDAQGEYLTGALPLDGIGPALDRLALLIARAWRAGAHVIHIQHRGPPGSLFDPAGPGGAILDQVAPSPGDLVIGKTSPNAFAGTDLGAQLAMLDRPPLVLAGFMTHMCISSTARAASDLGYRVTVAADATATRALPSQFGGLPVPAAIVQAAALAALADRFAAVVAVDAIPD